MTARRLALAYAALLLLSHGVRRWSGEPPPVPAGLAALPVSLAAAPSGDRGETRITYRRWEPAADPDAPWVLLLHGSPGSSADFVHLGPTLGTRYRVVAPDLPGFGRSEHRVPDYSVRAHAAYTAALLDRLGVDRVHVVGFSMGGGVALELTASAGREIRSLTLLSSIGVVELELLGGQRLNHAVHAVQLVAVWLLHEAVPHFGALDGFPIDVAYARNFYDTDQRPLRRRLEGWDGPALIVHGKSDFLVPVEAAEEHARLMPQSELVVFDADHFMVFRRDDRLAAAIAGFIDRVEAGRGEGRGAASRERQAAAARPFDPSVVPAASGITLFVVMALLAVAFVGLAVAVWLLLFVVPRLLTWTGRRRLVGWWRRWTRWEFWPPWLFYLPVVGAVAWLALRYRSPTLFTAANPAIPAGGFVGESKADILELLDPAAVARFRRVRASELLSRRLETLRGFLPHGDDDLPVVLKPDVGERGRGVVVARSWRRIAGYATAARTDFLVQEYVRGPEYGVFWIRQPGDERGRLFSITEKVLPAVVGDGSSTLERLILADERAVALAGVYLEQLAEEATRVPAAGERVVLTELGTHCRGAVFLDGARLATPELERAIEGIAGGIEGFFFGRFDLRAANEESFRAGVRLKVLELNGVTSEATSVYDPRHRLIAAYRTLFEQWRLAFEIGRRNRDAGAAVESVGSLARRILAARLGLY